jgi:hypothetical protein
VVRLNSREIIEREGQLARKRQKLKDLDYNSQEYWERLLTIDGCSMERGRSSKLTYVGDGATLESIEGERRMDTGRIKPKPQAD